MSEAPSLCVLSIVIPSEPVPKARARTVRGHSYTPARTRVAQDAVAWHARQSYRLSPMRGRVGIEIVFRCRSRRRCDVDNLAKLVMDGMNGILYRDDSQIDVLRIKRVHVDSGPCTVVTAWAV